MTSSRIPVIALVALAAALGSGCGGGGNDNNAATTNTTTTNTTTQPTGGGTTKTVSLKEYQFTPSDVTAKRGATLTVENTGKIAHNLTVEQGSKKLAGTPTFLPGKTETLKIDLKPGNYKMICTVPGHQQLGMKGTFTVK